MNSLKAPGRNFLLVTGTIAIAFNAVNLITVLLSEAAFGEMARTMGVGMSDFDWALTIGRIGFSVVAGIMAIVWRNETGPASRAAQLFRAGWGVITIAAIAGFGVQLGAAGFVVDVLGGLIGGAWTLPYMIPFLIGAKKNMDYTVAAPVNTPQEGLLMAIETCKANIQAIKNNPSGTSELDEARIKANAEEIARLEIELSKLT